MNPQPTSGLLRAATASAAGAAVIWCAVSLQQSVAHGRTQVNEERLVAGLTWMDTSKVLPLALLLLLPGIEVLVRRAGARRSVVAVARAVQVCVLVAAVAGAVDTWPFPWGSYAETFESRQAAGLPTVLVVPWQFLACVVAGMLLVVLALVRRRAPDLEPVLLVVLAGGFVVGSVWTPTWFWPAVAWAALAAWSAWLLRQQARATTGTGGPM